MIPLGVRKIQILQAIVLDYVATTKPVGSERLLEIQSLNCKSATIRNEMAELSEWGYLMQPHTSSGRIPTDRGYRYYVDELMNPPAALGAGEADDAQKTARKMQNDLEEILLQTCRILTGLTSYPSLATDPVVETTRLTKNFSDRGKPAPCPACRHAFYGTRRAPTGGTGRGAGRFAALVRMANFVNLQDWRAGTWRSVAFSCYAGSPGGINGPRLLPSRKSLPHYCKWCRVFRNGACFWKA